MWVVRCDTCFRANSEEAITPIDVDQTYFFEKTADAIL